MDLILSNINTEYKYLAKFYVSITEFAKFAGNTTSLESKIKEHKKLQIVQSQQLHKLLSELENKSKYELSKLKSH